MFAFAIWDSNLEKLFLARDRFGKKPLFLYEAQGQFLFCFRSEISPCLSGNPTSNKQPGCLSLPFLSICAGARDSFCRNQEITTGILVSLGTGKDTAVFLLFTTRQVRIVRVEPLPDDPVASFLAILDEAVEIRMVSDVPFGAFLSGGIDSSAIVALMSSIVICP